MRNWGSFYTLFVHAPVLQISRARHCRKSGLVFNLLRVISFSWKFIPQTRRILSHLQLILIFESTRLGMDRNSGRPGKAPVARVNSTSSRLRDSARHRGIRNKDIIEEFSASTESAAYEFAPQRELITDQVMEIVELDFLRITYSGRLSTWSRIMHV